MKVFVDTGSLGVIRAADDDPKIDGITTNPSLVRAAGVSSYGNFIHDALERTNKPISLEVISDDIDEMERQARLIASFGENAIVKIPVSTTVGKPTMNLVHALTSDGIKVNVTAVFTKHQMITLEKSFHWETQSIISIFAGRISDTGVDPVPTIQFARQHFGHHVEVLWASPRSVYDRYQAERAGADIVTMSPEIIAKLSLHNHDLTDFSRETCEMFYRDARAAGYKL